MGVLILRIINNQVKFFTWFFIVVFGLILWSYYEGVGDIQGVLTILSGHTRAVKIFKSGYFTSLNYGIYYLVIMPFFFKSVFQVYKIAYQITELKIDNNENNNDESDAVKEKIKNYSSKIVTFLEKKYSWVIFVLLAVGFGIQQIKVEFDNRKAIPMGWSIGRDLMLDLDSTQQRYKIDSVNRCKKIAALRKDLKEVNARQPNYIIEKTNALKQALHDSVAIIEKRDSLIGTLNFSKHEKPFYFKKNDKLTSPLLKNYNVNISQLTFSHSVNSIDQIPSRIEFLVFVISAKLFFSLFEAFVFFFNFNMLYCLIKFFSEPDKSLLFKSKEFVEQFEGLITEISLSGLFLTIFLYFRYITNMQKATFKPWANPLSSDQYTFLFGMLFIPIASFALFIYAYGTDTVIDIKATSFKRIISLYLPVVGFLIIFLIYLLTFDPYMASQLRFITKPLDVVNGYLINP